MYCPPYADNGYASHSIWTEQRMYYDNNSIQNIKLSANLAASVLLLACDNVQAGITTDDIDTIVH
jgi:hypothetical protein